MQTVRNSTAHESGNLQVVLIINTTGTDLKFP